MTDIQKHEVYLSLGANIGNRKRTLRQAIEQIEKQVGVVVRQSAFYETEPWGFESPNNFLNAAVCVQTDLQPIELLHVTQQIERNLGRTSDTKRNSLSDSFQADNPSYHDRVIDIDILLYDDISVNTPELTIPHPLMYEREFVMQPLREIMKQG